MERKITIIDDGKCTSFQSVGFTDFEVLGILTYNQKRMYAEMVEKEKRHVCPTHGKELVEKLNNLIGLKEAVEHQKEKLQKKAPKKAVKKAAKKVSKKKK